MHHFVDITLKRCLWGEGLGSFLEESCKQLIRSLFVHRLLAGIWIGLQKWSLLQKTISSPVWCLAFKFCLTINENVFLPVLPYICSLNMWRPWANPIPTLGLPSPACLSSGHQHTGSSLWEFVCDISNTVFIPGGNPKGRGEYFIIFADMTCQSLHLQAQK